MNFDPSKQHAIWYQGMDEAGRQKIWAPNRTTEADVADLVDAPVRKRLRRQRIIGLTIFLVALALLAGYLIVRILM